MNVGELHNAIENLPNDMPVFFRRVAPVAGNIETAGSANKDTFSSFGVVQDCLIVEPITDDESAPCLYCKHVHDSRIACPEYLANTPSARSAIRILYTCGQDDGLHEWDCAISRSLR